MPVGVDPPDEAVGEGVGLALGVGPQHVVAELVVDGLDPLALGVVFPALLPVLRMDQVDLAVLVAAAADPSPVEILEPFHLRWPQVVETAERLHRAPELELAVGAKEAGELSVYDAAFPYARKNHAHSMSRPCWWPGHPRPSSRCPRARNFPRETGGVNAEHPRKKASPRTQFALVEPLRHGAVARAVLAFVASFRLG